MKILKFSAAWCGPCKSLGQTIEKYYTGEVPIEEVDIDVDRQRAVDMGVRGVPTCILLDDNGVEINRKVGMMMIDEFEKFAKGE